jgi:putative transposase
MTRVPSITSFRVNSQTQGERDLLLQDWPQLPSPSAVSAREGTRWTYQRWREQYGGLKAKEAKRLKELSNENTRLKRIGPDNEVEIDALREVAKGIF